MTDFQKKILAYLCSVNNGASSWEVAYQVFPEKWRRPQGRGAMIGHIDRAAYKLQKEGYLLRSPPKDQWGAAHYYPRSRAYELMEQDDNIGNGPPLLRIIGDVHGHHEEYIELANQAQYSLCVGDVGFNYLGIKELDATRHRIVGGNHDNYHNLSPHFLGDHGVWTVPGFGDIFYVRGAFSIDHMYRKLGRDLFHEEELTYQQGLRALEEYEKVKPDFVVTHDMPMSIMPVCPFRRLEGYGDIPTSRTQKLLQAMLDIHKPKHWVFGHFHIDWKEEVYGVKFQCINILHCEDYWRKP